MNPNRPIDRRLPKPAPRGFATQRDRRRQEHQARLVVLEKSREAAALGISDRTLRYWRQRKRAGTLRVRPRGRRPVRSPRVKRNAVIAFLVAVGPQVGVPTLKETFPDMPRPELAHLLKRFRRVWRYKNQKLIHRIRWHQAGSVWALDHVKAPAQIDGKYRYLLNVRDLASQYQIAWLPVQDLTAETTIATLAPLFWEHGAPLVLKSDNGSAFIAEETRELLRKWGILHLLSPPRTPQYNGSCEAAGGSLKETTNNQAILHGRPGNWTSHDVERARQIRNRYGYRDDGTTPQDAWDSRTSITNAQRTTLRRAAERYASEEMQSRGESSEAVLNRAVQASVDRVAIARALNGHGYLSSRRKLVTPPIKSAKVANIM